MFLFLTLKHLLICVKIQIGDKIVEILYSDKSTLQTKQSTPLPLPLPLPSIQSWGVYCFVKVAQTVAQHCMEGRGKKELYFPLLKSVKRQKVPLERSISTNLSPIVAWYIFGPKSRVCLNNSTRFGIILIITIDYHAPK